MEKKTFVLDIIIIWHFCQKSNIILLMIDFEVYTKENTYYGSVLVANNIDLKPIEDEDGVIQDFKMIEDDIKLELQRASLITIWQYGNDPVEPYLGIQWAECLMEEILVTQLMQQIEDSLTNIYSIIKVEYTTQEIDGVERLVINYKVA